MTASANQQPCSLCGHPVPIAGIAVGARIPCPSCSCVIQVEASGGQRVYGEFAQGNTEVGAAPGGAQGAATPAPPGLPTEKASAPGSSPIPGYLVLEELGRGGMAVVFKARQISLDRTVALKIMAKRLASDPDFVKRFEREAKALAALNHPNIVSIFDRGQSGDKIFFVMEFVEGKSLRDLVKESGGRLPQERTIRLMIQVAEALGYVHKRGTIHRDIKPENVLVTAGDVVKVTDFGLAAMADPSGSANLTQANMMMGTLNYMPPEQRTDAKSVDHRADIYSYGVMLYELLTGSVPLGKWEPASTLVPGLDPRLDDVIGMCIKNNRAERYQSIDEARGVLKETLDGPAPVVELNIPLTGVDSRAGTRPPPRNDPPARPAPKPAPEPAGGDRMLAALTGGAGGGRRGPAPTPAPEPVSREAPTRTSGRGAEPEDVNRDLEALVEAARKNMTAQRTRGLPTKIQPFPGLEAPRSRFRIFLGATLVSLLAITGIYMMFETWILMGYLVRVTPKTVEQMGWAPMQGGLLRLRALAQERSKSLASRQPDLFAPVVKSADVRWSMAGLVALSRSPHPRAAELIATQLDREEEDVFRTAVQALWRMGSSDSLRYLNQALLGSNASRVTFVREILKKSPPAAQGAGPDE